GLELVVGTVQLVDEQYASWIRQRLQQGASHQEALRVDRLRLLGAQSQELALIVPVVEGVVDVDSLVALEPHQGHVRGGGRRVGQPGLPAARRACAQRRPRDRERQGEKGGGPLVAQVSLAGEGVAQLVDPLRRGHAASTGSASQSRTAASTRTAATSTALSTA